MAEYTNVEKPFLEKLRQAHWQVIDQGIATYYISGPCLSTEPTDAVSTEPLEISTPPLGSVVELNSTDIETNTEISTQPLDFSTQPFEISTPPSDLSTPPASEIPDYVLMQIQELNPNILRTLSAKLISITKDDIKWMISESETLSAEFRKNIQKSVPLYFPDYKVEIQNQEKFVISISYTNLEADLAPDLTPDLTPHDLRQPQLQPELQFKQPQLQPQLQYELQTEQYNLQYEQPQFDIQALYQEIESKPGPSRDKIGTKSAQNRHQVGTKLKRVLKTQK